jgi:serine/threonine protein kinase
MNPNECCSDSYEHPKGWNLVLNSVLGCGAYGAVFRTTRTIATNRAGENISDTVALKEIVFDTVPDEIDEVLREVSFFASMCHPNIVKLHDAFFHEGVRASPSSSPTRGVIKGAPSFSPFPALCILEECIDGGSVSDYLSSTSRAMTSTQNDVRSIRLTEEQIACIAQDVLSALTYLHHGCRLVHRDVKCSNMLLSGEEGVVKLCDFGTCGRISSRTHQRATVIGTPGWMAPEVLCHSADSAQTKSSHSVTDVKHSFPADIWSFGASMLELVMPRSANSDPMFSQYVAFVSTLPCSRPPLFKPLDKQVPLSRFSALEEVFSSSKLLDFIAGCLRKDPSERPTAKELLHHPFMTDQLGDSAIRKPAMIKRLADETKRFLSKRKPIKLPAPNALISNGRLAAADEEVGLERWGGSGWKFTWKLPDVLRDLHTSEEVKKVPSQFNKTPPQNAPIGSLQSRRGVFDNVLLPATLTAAPAMMQRVFSIHRLLGGTAATERRRLRGDVNYMYSVNELQASQLSFDRHQKLLEALLNNFHAAEKRIPGFSHQLCCSFVSLLLTNSEDVESVKASLAYFAELQRDPLGHFHRFLRSGKSHGAPSTNVVTSPSRDAPQKGEGQSQPSLPSFQVPVGLRPRGLDGPLLDVIDWARVPDMPDIYTSHIRASQSSKKHRGDAKKPVQVPVDIAPHIYNDWIQQFRKRVLDQ